MSYSETQGRQRGGILGSERPSSDRSRIRRPPRCRVRHIIPDDTSKTTLKRLEKPEDLVRIIAFLASGESDFITSPRILGECSARSIVDIAKAIDTSEFRRLVRTMKKNYATDFSRKILAPTGRIEIPFFMKEMMKGF